MNKFNLNFDFHLKSCRCSPESLPRLTFDPGAIAMQKLLQLPHDGVSFLGMIFETRRYVEEWKWNVTKRVIVLEGIYNIRISLQSDCVAIHHDCLQLVVDLQGFREQSCTKIAHQIAANIKNLQVLVASKGIDDIVNVRLQLILGNVELRKHEVILLDKINKRIHHGADVLELHALKAFDQVKRSNRWILADSCQHGGHLGIKI